MVLITTTLYSVVVHSLDAFYVLSKTSLLYGLTFNVWYLGCCRGICKMISMFLQCARLFTRCLSSQPSKVPVLTMFTKDSCQLCEEALTELQKYKDRYHLEKVDISLPENSHWYKMYRYEIPVFHLNGRYFMKHRIDHEKLKKELFLEATNNSSKASSHEK